MRRLGWLTALLIPALAFARPKPGELPDAVRQLEEDDRTASDMIASIGEGDIADAAWVRRKVGVLASLDQFWRSRRGTEAYTRLTPDEQTWYTSETARRLEKNEKFATKEFAELFDEVGWLRPDVYGARAEHDAWVIVHHSGSRRLQRAVLAAMEPLVATREASGEKFAYLHDRLAVLEKRPQRYGTQGICEGRAWKPFPLVDPAQVDQWRASVLLDGYAAYTAAANASCGQR